MWKWHEIQVSVAINRFIGTHHAYLCTCCLWLLSSYSSRVELLQQRPSDLQILKYLLSGPLQKKFAGLTHLIKIILVWKWKHTPQLCVKILCWYKGKLWYKEIHIRWYKERHKIKKKTVIANSLRYQGNVTSPNFTNSPVISSGRHAIPCCDHQMATPMMVQRFLSIYLQR